ncbi:hypothetical protein BCR33DRAFT_753313 [Rhizoclosmatium globosum]|uniref:Electron transfer flavoprotein-ubiquinone oxidoreductase n=1 Tax=Rhizoclosmatium globosum TaxID=329046 RepID=A0A1Y2CMG5_9FUNG|nr:hypothetical protein BCR33DRAFT_753313 [Rhizoclosmatium globosum]|eukprot:ORY48211.1 hypothetical protein BCR33DRAFT_753313 [Rhizoclosmatium globosum]
MARAPLARARPFTLALTSGASRRFFHVTRPVRLASVGDAEVQAILNGERFAEEVDVCIVGAGPAGLSAAIRIRQLAQEQNKDVRVFVVEKGSEVDKMYFLTEQLSIPIPHPPQMSNKGNYIVSLSQFVRWLGEQAEEAGVEVYPAFAASEVLYNEDGSVAGIATNDVGISKSGLPKDSFERGMEIRAKVTLFAEVIHKFDLRKDSDPQTYGLGVKEVWELDPAKHDPGLVLHTIGWPVDYKTYGVYHFGDNLCSIGYVVGLDYENPTLSPYREFQRYKHHPLIKKYLEGGKILAYGARALNEGGLQSVPKLAFPGGALIGCSAGFLNVPKIKGTHTAMKSGMLAEGPITLDAYEPPTKLHEVRNVRPSFHTALGLYGGVAYSGLDTLIFKGKTPWTFRNPKPDHATLKPLKDVKPIEYPKPDGVLVSSCWRTLAEQDWTCRRPACALATSRGSTDQLEKNYPVYGGPEQKFCPAGVYEYLDDAENPGKKRFQINASNCIHCKTCDIKDPSQNIDWTVPEGGGGPKYSIC